MIVSNDTIILTSSPRIRDNRGYMNAPPFQITMRILHLTEAIQQMLGEFKSAHSLIQPTIKLRKENQIKTIKYSLAIEGNSLSEDQITALLENQRVVGPQKDILEVKNALHLYSQINKLNPLNEKDFLRSHQLLMNELVPRPGKYRTKAVGIFKGDLVNKMAPPAKLVPELMQQLFQFINKNKELSFLIKSCVFHYELEFIHPFEDGNGRMGRLWQQLLLMKQQDLFQYISIESIVFERQPLYYNALEESDRLGASTPFIEFCLEVILKALTDYQQLAVFKKTTPHDRLLSAIDSFKTHRKNHFSRKDYLQFHKTISTATASRDLIYGVKKGILTSDGDKALTIYRISK